MSYEKFLAFLQSTQASNMGRVLSRTHKAHIPNAQRSHMDILIFNIPVCSSPNTNLMNSAIFGLLSDHTDTEQHEFYLCKIYSPCKQTSQYYMTIVAHNLCFVQ
jgi:hypothetical protein